MMHDTMGGMAGGVPTPMIAMGVALAIVVAGLAALLAFFMRRAPADRLSIDEMVARGGAPPLRLRAETALHRQRSAPAGEPRDTIFVLPDISHYTQFMTASRFAFGHAQHVIFELINAMIDAATRTMELSKLEGDAALFFADAQGVSREAVGQTVFDIFRGFYVTRRSLIDANICPCTTCQRISGLDLKIFVHRGQATQFQFRGTVDFFGMDLILLHRLMKNNVGSHRYVMVTDAARDACALPRALPATRIREAVEHIGQVPATVFRIDDELVEELAASETTAPLTKTRETWHKLQQNLRSVGAAVIPRGSQG